MKWLVFALLFFGIPLYAYNPKDATILRYLRTSAQALTHSPSLWNVRHEIPSEGFPQTYQVIVAFPHFEHFPRLTFLFDKNASVTFQKTLPPSHFVPLSQGGPSDRKYPAALPYGTFDFFSAFLYRSELTEYLFSGASLFSGNLRIINDFPMWVYPHKQELPYEVRISKNTFFPKEIIRYTDGAHTHTWTFAFSQAYTPAGPTDTAFTKISLSTQSLTSQAFMVTWSFVRFLDSEEKNKYHSGAAKTLAHSSFPLDVY